MFYMNTKYPKESTPNCVRGGSGRGREKEARGSFFSFIFLGTLWRLYNEKISLT